MGKPSAKVFKRYPITLFLIGLITMATLGFMWIEHIFPGSGFTVQKSDGLIKGVPLGIEFKVRM